MVWTTADPLAATLSGLSAALSVTVMFAVRVEAAVGEKTTLSVQVASGAIVEAPFGQLSVSMKSPGFAPLAAMLVMVSGAVPVLVNVTVCAALDVPTF